MKKEVYAAWKSARAADAPKDDQAAFDKLVGGAGVVKCDNGPHSSHVLPQEDPRATIKHVLKLVSLDASGCRIESPPEEAPSAAKGCGGCASAAHQTRLDWLGSVSLVALAAIVSRRRLRDCSTTRSTSPFPLRGGRHSDCGPLTSRFHH